MTVIDSMFDDFFSKRIPQEGFVIDTTNHFGLIDGRMPHALALHGYAITMSGDVVIPELNPVSELAAAETRVAA